MSDRYDNYKEFVFYGLVTLIREKFKRDYEEKISNIDFNKDQSTFLKALNINSYCFHIDEQELINILRDKKTSRAEMIDMVISNTLLLDDFIGFYDDIKFYDLDKEILSKTDKINVDVYRVGMVKLFFEIFSIDNKNIKELDLKIFNSIKNNYPDFSIATKGNKLVMYNPDDFFASITVAKFLSPNFDELTNDLYQTFTKSNIKDIKINTDLLNKLSEFCNMIKPIFGNIKSLKNKFKENMELIKEDEKTRFLIDMDTINSNKSKKENDNNEKTSENR